MGLGVSTTYVPAIGLTDLDKAVYQFLVALNMQVTKYNATTNELDYETVPIRVMTPERFSQMDDTYEARDDDKKLILPIVTFKRTDVAEGNNWPRNMQTSVVIYDDVNTNIKYRMAAPRYVSLSYECHMWSQYMTQINEMLQTLMHGTKNGFATMYYSDSVEVAGLAYTANHTFSLNVSGLNSADNFDNYEAEERLVRYNFGIVLNGFILSSDNRAVEGYPFQTLIVNKFEDSTYDDPYPGISTWAPPDLGIGTMEGFSTTYS
jgi:hypothetical protein